jgi:hypothetical protein
MTQGADALEEGRFMSSPWWRQKDGRRCRELLEVRCDTINHQGR